MPEVDLAAYKEQVFGNNGQAPIHTPTSEKPINEPPVTPVVEPAPAPAVVEPPVTPTPDDEYETVDADEYLKSTLGYDDWDAAKADIAALKAKAETPAEIKYANEQSKQLHELLKEGKTKEVRQFLETQEKLADLTSLEITDSNAAEIIKFGMQLKYKDLSPQQIDYKYNKQFAIPKEPVQGVSEDEDEFAARKEEWKQQVADVKMDKIIEAKLLRPELEKLKTEIKLPDISKPPVTETSNPEDEKELQRVEAETKEAYSKLSTKDISMVFKFNDEASKLAFDIAYEPDKGSFEKAVSLASDMKAFFESYYDKDGNPDRKGFLKDLYAGRNIQKIVSEAIVQATNQTKSWFLKNQKNIGDGTQRNYVMPPVTDIEKLKQQVFG